MPSLHSSIGPACVTGGRTIGRLPQNGNRIQCRSFSVCVSTARISSDGRQSNPRHSLKTVSTVGIRRPRSIRETYPRSSPAISASFSCVMPASRLNRASIRPTMRFKSCGSSNEFKQQRYQELQRISSHYSTNFIAIGFRSQEDPVSVDAAVSEVSRLFEIRAGRSTPNDQYPLCFRSILHCFSYRKNASKTPVALKITPHFLTLTE